MEIEKKIKTLQMYYAGALADATLRMGKEGILDKVTAEKKNEQLLIGKIRAQQLGIQKAEQVFEVLPEIFECANWKVEKNETGFNAVATSCMLCAIAKKIGAQSPCNIFCLDPMEGIVKGVDAEATYEVESTLWDGQCCSVKVNR